MDAKRFTDAELRKLTNLGDLVGPQSAEQAPDVPSTPTALVTHPPKRSTTDPFEINFYQVDIIEGLGKGHVKAPVRWFAWLFLAGPYVAIWPFLVFDFMGGSSNPVRTPADFVFRVAGIGVVTVICGFWPYVLLRRPEGRR